MESLRKICRDDLTRLAECSLCQAPSQRWDRIAGRAYCPGCEESLARGEGAPLIVRTEANSCAACEHAATVRFLTFPLNAALALEFDLCPEHLRGLLGRHLGPSAFRQLRQRLHGLGLTVEEIFLLHNAFYDANGRALQPAVDLG
jgi:hypothetical protein